MMHFKDSSKIPIPPPVPNQNTELNKTFQKALTQVKTLEESYKHPPLKTKIQELVELVLVLKKNNDKDSDPSLVFTGAEKALLQKVSSKRWSKESSITTHELTALLEQTHLFLKGQLALDSYEHFIKTHLTNKPSKARIILYKIMMAIGSLAVVAGVVLGATGVGTVPGAALVAGGLFLAGSAYGLHRHKSKWHLFQKTHAMIEESYAEKTVLALPDHNPMPYQQIKDCGFGYYQTKGHKPSQEDALTWQVLNKETLKDLTPKAIGHRLWTTYQILAAGQASQRAGTTASTTVYDGKGNLITATLADTVAFAAIYDKNGLLLEVKRLNSIVHKPDHPSGRIWNKLYQSIAVSRAIGDAGFKEQLCADAQIDSTSIDDLLKDKDIDKQRLGSIKIITACDGFTDVAKEQTLKGHEALLSDYLKDIPNVHTLDEASLAQRLTEKALTEGSRDNVTIAVQTINSKHNNPMLMGIYDGHSGPEVASYVASHLPQIFAHQCALNEDEYAEQEVSVHNHPQAYLRDHPGSEESIKPRENKYYSSL